MPEHCGAEKASLRGSRRRRGGWRVAPALPRVHELLLECPPSTHVAAAPRSTDADARADISEAMTLADAECERGRAEHVYYDPSLQRALFVIPACWT